MNLIRELAELAAGALGLIVALALFVALFVGGMFYRTQCPSEVHWNWNIIPFVAAVNTDEQSCRVDTATAYYAGKVPIIGGPLRDGINGLQSMGR